MSNPKGTHMGGIRTLEDMRLRCVCSGDCWHLRTARGRKYPAGKPMHIFSGLHGTSMLARRLVIELHAGAPVPRDMVVIDTCHEHDCINPAHLRIVTRKQAVQQAAARGRMSTPAKLIANRLIGAARSRISTEVWGWVYESTQSSAELGRVLGIAGSHIAAKRASHRAALMGVVA